jgi:hypothetical protein
VQYVAVGYDVKCEVASYLNKGHDNGGIFVLDADDADNIKTSMKQNPNELYKFRSFLAYQMELGYDLALAPASNVSSSFGFDERIFPGCAFGKTLLSCMKDKSL